eukprot:TRINITY_DN6622_c0_g1_i1.p1 TRINITY_DN6622_c0_g1~~TRINITY_DN6622_c0_g1_i1.p1  ORF type:complete len:417 (+),score=111.81 TRINITY_DN6622_c0_g1_i1:76-1326(+)
MDTQPQSQRQLGHHQQYQQHQHNNALEKLYSTHSSHQHQQQQDRTTDDSAAEDIFVMSPPASPRVVTVDTSNAHRNLNDPESMSAIRSKRLKGLLSSGGCLSPVYEEHRDEKQAKLHEHLMDQLYEVFENAQRMDQALLAFEAVELERLRILTLDEANSAYEAWEIEERVKLAVEMEEQGRNEQCIQKPWLSSRPRERVIEQLYQLGQEREKVADYEAVIQMEFEEKMRRETLHEYETVHSEVVGRLSWRDLDKIEETARMEKLTECLVYERVDVIYAKVLDEFESFVDSMGLESCCVTGCRDDGERLRQFEQMSCCGGTNGQEDYFHHEEERKETKRKVVKLEEQERLARIVRDCSTDYRSVQFAGVTPILNDIRLFAEKMERVKNQKLAIQLMEEERTRRILAQCGVCPYHHQS